jgi:cephalosporin hydroxylase
MRRRIGRLRRSLLRRSQAFLNPPAVTVGSARHVKRPDIDEADQTVVDAFHQLYYRNDENNTRLTLHVNWLGYRAMKCPFDLWVYQEIIVETKPELIVESGTRFGGTSLFLATMLDLTGSDARVISIDVTPDPGFPKHPRIEYLTGSSLDADIAERVKRAAAGKRTMLILDSLHTADHVEKELRLYHQIVSPGCYLVVEDTNLNGHPVEPDHGPGPGEAVSAFLATTDDFVVDQDRERFLMTLNPGGYLRRVG